MARVTGDSCEGNTFKADFEGHEISYDVSKWTAHQLYEALEPRLDAHEVVLLDAPKGHKSTFGYATGGWVAAPVVGRLVRRIAPLVGMTPAGEEKEPAPGNPLFVPVKAGTMKAEARTVAAH